jgi:pimeloyl-ACP methyl ester carboxylesterase
LHTLLDKADVKPPLVLVGHSYGGWLVRLYASTYPTDVVGVVVLRQNLVTIDIVDFLQPGATLYWTTGTIRTKSAISFSSGCAT